MQLLIKAVTPLQKKICNQSIKYLVTHTFLVYLNFILYFKKSLPLFQKNYSSYFGCSFISYAKVEKVWPLI